MTELWEVDVPEDTPTSEFPRTLQSVPLRWLPMRRPDTSPLLFVAHGYGRPVSSTETTFRWLVHGREFSTTAAPRGERRAPLINRGVTRGERRAKVSATAGERTCCSFATFATGIAAAAAAAAKGGGEGCVWRFLARTIASWYHVCGSRGTQRTFMRLPPSDAWPRMP